MENTSRFPAPRNNGGILSWYSVLTHAWCRLFLFIRAYPSWCSVLTHHGWNIVLAYSRNPPFAPFLFPTLLANPPARIPRALTTSHQSPWNNYTFHLPRVLNSPSHDNQPTDPHPGINKYQNNDCVMTMDFLCPITIAKVFLMLHIY